MKAHTIATLFLGFIIGFIGMELYREKQQNKDEATPEASEFDRTLNAIEYVESECNPLAIGDNGNAIGSFQIWQIYVNDCNRILGRQEFSLEDRNSRKRSREMVRVYMSRYCPSGDPEKMAKIHNGGPQGHKKKATEKYWLKVKARMELQSKLTL